MTEPRRAPRQLLPDAPRSADGRPHGTKCRLGCRPPSGTSQAHCSTCHSTTRALSDWDRHRQDGYCLDLATLGLVERDEVWASPEGHQAAERAREMLAASRRAAA